jgi:hypothetical protein
MIDPLSGDRMPVRHLRRVLFPEPFDPMMPKVEPRGMSKLTASPEKRRLQVLVLLVVEPEVLGHFPN